MPDHAARSAAAFAWANQPLKEASSTAGCGRAGAIGTALTQSLNAARATGAYERKLAALARVPLLIIDDFEFKRKRPAKPILALSPMVC